METTGTSVCHFQTGSDKEIASLSWAAGKCAYLHALSYQS